MPNISDYHGLEKYMKMTIQQGLEVVAQEVAEYLSQMVKSYIYRRPQSEYYTRTKQFLDSITVGKLVPIPNGYQIEVYFDYTKIYPMNQRIENGNVFNQHMSLNSADTYGGKTISYWLIQWLEKGQDSPIYSHPGYGFIEETRDWTEEELRDILNLAFTKAGFTVSVN